MIASKTTEVKYVRKIRFISYPAGRYDPDTSYVCTEASGPFVEEDGQYYAMYKEGTWLGSSVGRTPKEDYAQNGTKATWRLMDKYMALIVEMFFADYAKLGSAVFLGNYMFSQYGLRNGVQSNAYQNFNPDDLDAFRPNVYIDWLNGYMEVQNGNFNGHVSATSGTFGDFKIDGLYLVSSHTYSHGNKLGDGLFESWNGKNNESASNDSSSSYICISSSGRQISSNYFLNGWAQNITKNFELIADNHAAYLALFGYSYKDGRIYACFSDFGDYRSVGGRFQGHFAPHISIITSFSHTIGEKNYKEQTLIVTGTASITEIMLPSINNPTYPLIEGETYEIIVGNASAVRIQANAFQQLVVKGTLVSSYTVNNTGTEKIQSVKAVWDGTEKWYIILI